MPLKLLCDDNLIGESPNTNFLEGNLMLNALIQKRSERSSGKEGNLEINGGPVHCN